MYIILDFNFYVFIICFKLKNNLKFLDYIIKKGREMFACCLGRSVLDQVEDPTITRAVGGGEPRVLADEDPTPLQNPLVFGWSSDYLKLQQAFCAVKYEFKKEVSDQVGYAFIILAEIIYGSKDPALYKSLISNRLVPVLMSCVQKVLMVYDEGRPLMHSGKEMLAVLGQLVKTPDGLDAVRRIEGGLELLERARACPLFQESGRDSSAPSGP